MQLHLKITGTLLILLAFLHYIFPRYFNWKEELQGLSIINRQMMYIHAFFIALVVFLMGLLCLTSSTEIATTALGKKVALGLGIFWMTRLFIQFFGYTSHNWRGKRFETAVHVLFSGLWTYLSAVFLWIYISD